MDKTVFLIRDMDCMAEEQMIRMKLKDNAVVIWLDFDLENRRLTVLHFGGLNGIQTAIDALHLGSEMIETMSGSEETVTEDGGSDRKLLWTGRH